VLARVGLLGAEGAGEEDAQHTFEFNVLQHSARELAEASYQHELPEPSSTYVNIDWKHMGVGGDNSWSRSVLSPYFVPPGMHPLCLTVPCQLLLRAVDFGGFWVCRRELPLGHPARASRPKRDAT
jgi:hypothetical protein